jgi:hypothetical protein
MAGLLSYGKRILINIKSTDNQKQKSTSFYIYIRVCLYKYTHTYEYVHTHTRTNIYVTVTQPQANRYACNEIKFMMLFRCRRAMLPQHIMQVMRRILYF